MAMGKEAIENCRTTISYFNSGWENGAFRSYFEDLNSDNEYAKFIAQTNAGKELNEKLSRTLDLYGQLWNTLEELGDKTRTFLKAQEALNEHFGGSAGSSGVSYGSPVPNSNRTEVIY